MEELVSSVRERGVLQPIIVQKQERGFLLVAGERRWRAAREVGLESIPAVVTDGDPEEIALIENIQRENLHPMEEAEALRALKEKRQLTHEQLAKLVGKSRVTVTELLSLTRLPPAIREACRTFDKASKAQLVQVLREPTEAAQLAAWRRVAEQGAPSREVGVARTTDKNIGTKRRRRRLVVPGRGEVVVHCKAELPTDDVVAALLRAALDLVEASGERDG